MGRGEKEEERQENRETGAEAFIHGCVSDCTRNRKKREREVLKCLVALKGRWWPEC